MTAHVPNHALVAGTSRRGNGFLRRVELRPTPDHWGEDEPMTLNEAVAIFFPQGPLTVSSLRTEIRKGKLLTAEVAGRLYVTPAAIRALFKPSCPDPQKALVSSSGQPAQKNGRPLDGLSETDQKRLAQDAARATLRQLRSNSPNTSSRSGRRNPQQAATVLPIRRTS